MPDAEFREFTPLPQKPRTVMNNFDNYFLNNFLVPFERRRRGEILNFFFTFLKVEKNKLRCKERLALV